MVVFWVVVVVAMVLVCELGFGVGKPSVTVVRCTSSVFGDSSAGVVAEGEKLGILVDRDLWKLGTV